MWFFKLIIILAVVNISRQHVVSTVQGRIRGTTRNGYVAYEGIPYVSPTGRFKTSGIAPLWTGIRQSEQHHCLTISRVEDCLNLDVYVPTTANAPWPVLVWVRGGSGQYHPGKLVQQSIIVVVVSHRVGPLGFLCLNDDKIPGNAGVKDVLMALRWIGDNIVAFKGNPNKVVIAGQSFGAAMVEALTISPMAENLFHGAILQSGSILSPWAFNYDAKERAIAVANMISSGNYSSVLVNATLEDLVSQSDKLAMSYFPFGMCVEKPFKNKELLLAEKPYEFLKKKHRSVPMIVGYNSDEAYIFVSILKQSKVLSKMKKDLSFLLPEELMFLNEREVQHVVRQVQDAYFKYNITFAAILSYHRDAYFLNHVHRSVRHHSSNAPVYYYEFSYVGESGVQEESGVEKTGAAHSDELAYLFPETGNDVVNDDGVVQNNLIQLWTNFVKHLNPTPRNSGMPLWEAVDPSDLRLLEINKQLQIKQFTYSKEIQMWDEIYDKYYYSRHH